MCFQGTPFSKNFQIKKIYYGDILVRIRFDGSKIYVLFFFRGCYSTVKNLSNLSDELPQFNLRN